jgi:putative PIN family toxin of toxin-antitoxin system
VASIRAVLDTNVWISAILWTGLPHRILTEVESGRIRTALTPFALDELAASLARPKFARRLDELDVTLAEVVSSVLATAHLVSEAPLATAVSGDLDDDRILAGAVAYRARYLVTGDRQVLSIRRHAGVAIVSPREFWERYAPGRPR